MFIIFNKKRKTGVWGGYYLFETLEDIKKFLEGCEKKYLLELEVYKLGRKVELKFNEVEFKGLTSE